MKQLKIKIGIWALAFLTLSPLAITSSFAAVAETFPEAAIAEIQLIASIPYLSTIIVSFFSGALTTKFSYKTIALIGTVILGIGGLLPLVFHRSLLELWLGAGILGIGLGLTTTMMPILTAEYFPKAQRLAMMGKNTAAIAIGKMFFLKIGGLLGSISWHYSYFVFLIVLPIFAALFFCLPGEPPKAPQTLNAPKVKGNFLKTVKTFSPQLGIVFLLSFVASLAMLIYNTNLALVMASRGFEGPATAGFVGGFGTIGGIVAGLTLKTAKAFFKDKLLSMAFLIVAISFFILGISTTFAGLFIGSLAIAVGTAYLFASIPFFASLLAKPFQMGLAMAFYNSFNALGKLLSPILLNGLGGLSGTAAYFFGAAALLAVGLYLWLANFAGKAMASHLST